MSQVITSAMDPGDGVFIGGSDPNDANQKHLKTMTFQINSKTKSVSITDSIKQISVNQSSMAETARTKVISQSGYVDTDISHIDLSRIGSGISQMELEQLPFTGWSGGETLENTVQERDDSLISTIRNSASGADSGIGWTKGDTICTLVGAKAAWVFGTIGLVGGPLVSYGAGLAGGAVVSKICANAYASQAETAREEADRVAKEEAKKQADAQAAAAKQKEEADKKAAAAAKKAKKEQADKDKAAKKDKSKDKDKPADNDDDSNNGNEGEEDSSGSSSGGSTEADNPMNFNGNNNSDEGESESFGNINSDINYGPDGNSNSGSSGTHFDVLTGINPRIDYGQDRGGSQENGRHDGLSSFDPTTNWGQDHNDSQPQSNPLIDLLEKVNPRMLEEENSPMVTLISLPQDQFI